MNMLLLCSAMSVLPAGGLIGNPDVEVVKAKAAPTQLQFEVEPANVIIFVDNKKKGVAKKLKAVNVKPGTHTVKLVWNKDETEFDIKVEKGRTVVVKYAFEDSGKENTPPAEETPPPAEDNKKKDAPKGKQDKAPSPPPDDDEPGDDLDSDIPR
ncbi:MAG: hypothetical protein ABIJ09_22095 [Pseudomonadota bacterium]